MRARIESQVIQKDIKNIAHRIKGISEELSGRTILIAGGAGFLGTYIVLTLDYLNENILSEPCKIIVVDNFITGLKDSLAENENLKIIKGDISKPLNIDGPIDYILHAASLASPIFYNKFPLETIDAGVAGTRNLLELAREKKVKSFKFFSSSEVYGNPDPKFVPSPESYNGNVSCTGPRACYDEPKRLGETLCMAYADLYGVPVKISRTFNTYGPGMRLDDGRVIANFVTACLKGEKIPVYGNGKNSRTFCYIEDAIVGYFKILFSNHQKGIFNVGSDEQEISMNHLADIIQGIVDNEESSTHNIRGPNETYTKSDPNRRCPDLTRIRTVLDYRPEVTLVQGIRRFVTWVKEELSQGESINQGKQNKCQICQGENLFKFISLGNIPLANNLLPSGDKKEVEKFPLELNYCNDCHLCQLGYHVNPKKMFDNYLYVTSTTDSFKKHFSEMATSLKEHLGLKEGSLVVDIGSNDGLLLKEFIKNGLKAIGVEPAENICQIARDNNVETLCDYFNEESVRTIAKLKGKADLITANNVFAHMPNINKVTENVKKLMKEEGVFVIEVQYLLNMLNYVTFDNIYHEHLNYYSLLSLNELFKRHDMEIFNVQKVDTHGGSIRVFIQNKGSRFGINDSLFEFIREEELAGLKNPSTYEEFANKIKNNKQEVLNFIDKEIKNGKKIIGYGAPAKATILLNFYGLNNTHIRYIIEDNNLKHNKIVPGTEIPIVGKENIQNSHVQDYVAILAWNFAKEIIEKNQDLTRDNSKFITLSPKLKIF